MTLSEGELFEDFVLNAELRVLVMAELFKLAKSMEDATIRFDLSNGDANQLAFTKCRGEGAMKLYRAFETHIEKLRVASSTAKAKTKK